MARLTAVVIEEDPQVRRLLRRTLSRHRFRLVEVTTPTDGLLEAEKRRVDIVLLDLQPRNDKAVEMIRRLREWSQVPILVLAAIGQDSEVAAALDAGVNDYISGPFTGPENLS